MLDTDEAESVRNIFGSTEAQVRRDHAISHVLYALQKLNSKFAFFGGTALARTFLIEGRLSEDIDLYTSNRQGLCDELNGIPDLIEQEFPQAYWSVLPSLASDAQGALLVCDSSTQIKVQVVDSRTRNWQFIPTSMNQIHQRYADVLPTKLVVPTFDGFVAMKVAAWFDRGTPRDLYDLEALSWLGDVTESVRQLIGDLRGYRLTKAMLDRPVSGLWYEELAHQTKLDKTQDECLSRVLKWWSSASDRPSE